MIGPYRVEAYVIASSDGMIADETGVMPLALQIDSDKRYFEDALERVEAVVHGRHSQEIQPKSPFRRRLVLTRAVPALAPDPLNPRARLWNPAGASFVDACRSLGVEAGLIAIIGGPQVYRLFLEMGYDVFHLCQAVGVTLGRGLPVFGRDRFGGDPGASLKSAGLKAAAPVDLGDGVTLTDWTRT
jgi:dihydrofolate reductase